MLGTTWDCCRSPARFGGGTPRRGRDGRPSEATCRRSGTGTNAGGPLRRRQPAQAGREWQKASQTTPLNSALRAIVGGGTEGNGPERELRPKFQRGNAAPGGGGIAHRCTSSSSSLEDGVTIRSCAGGQDNLGIQRESVHAALPLLAVGPTLAAIMNLVTRSATLKVGERPSLRFRTKLGSPIASRPKRVAEIPDVCRNLSTSFLKSAAVPMSGLYEKFPSSAREISYSHPTSDLS